MNRGGAGKRKGRHGWRRRFGSTSPAGRAWNLERLRAGWWTHTSPAFTMQAIREAFAALPR